MSSSLIEIQEVTASNSVIKYLSGQLKTAGLRLVPNQLYLAFEDFQRADPEKKRVVLIGCTGAGKSTIGNIAAGWKLVQLKDHLKVHLLGKAGGAQAENAFSEEGRAELCGRGQEVQVQVK